MKKHTNEVKCNCGIVHQGNYDSTRIEPIHKQTLGNDKSIVSEAVRVRNCSCGAVLQLPNEKTIKASSNGFGVSIFED